MKTTLLSLLLAVAPSFTALVQAQEEKRDAPREEKPAEHKDAPNPVEGQQREFRQKMEKHMKAAMEEAGRLEAEGKKEEAQKRRAQAEQQRDAAIMEHQKAMMQKRHAMMKQRKEGAPRPDGPPRPELESKLKHVEQAMAHLREAGMPDQAQHLAPAAERIRRALRGEDGPRPGGFPPDAGRRPEGGPGGEVEALRREIEELRQAVRRLHEPKKD